MTEYYQTPSLLIALPQLQDPNFQRTVILILDHNSDGAMGVIINRPSEIPLRNLITADEIDIPASVPGWFGGPVAVDHGLILHNQPHDDKSTIVSADLCLSSSEFALKELVGHAHEYDQHKNQIKTLGIKSPMTYQVLYPFRFIIGYAGWGAKQLEEEVRLGAWLQIPMDYNLAFNTPWQEMREAAIGTLGVKPMDIVPAMNQYLN